MRQLTIVNQTSDIIVWDSENKGRSQSRILLPSLSCKITVSAIQSEITLSCLSNRGDAEKDWTAHPDAYKFRLPMSLGAMWKVVNMPEGCPWWIYRGKHSRKHHSLLILPRRDLASFLSDFPDSLPLSSLLLPGTHDTMAFYGWPISQCQSLATPLAVQLKSGIRVLDIRLAVIKNRLIAYHGLYPQREPFQSILTTVHDFLTAPKTCRETIVMSIKQEDFATTSSVVFSRLVHDEIMNGPGGWDMWFLDDKIPTLGEARGKVVMLSRFGGDGAGWDRGLEGMGIHPTTWPNSAKNGFTWQCKDTLVRTQDWYNIPSFLSIPEKTKLATEILLPLEDRSSSPTLSISFFSAASIPLAFPPTIARGFGYPKLGLGVEGVNGRLGAWLIDMLSSGSAGHQGNARMSLVGEKGSKVRIRGWALLDFYRDPEDNAVVPLLVECNYRGRRSGEEGWP